MDVPAIGPSIAAKVRELLDAGRCRYVEELKAQVPVAAADLLDVPGIGPRRAQMLYQRLGISTILGLQHAAQEHRLRGLPGFGGRLDARVAQQAVRVAQRTRRLLPGVALPAAEEVAGLPCSSPAVKAALPARSIRRMQDTIGDIDMLVASHEPSAVWDALVHLPIVQEV